MFKKKKFDKVKKVLKRKIKKIQKSCTHREDRITCGKAVLVGASTLQTHKD